MLAACVAPAFVRAESLMILPAPRKIWTPEIVSPNGKLNIYSAAGVLLASMGMDAASHGSINGKTKILETGLATHYRVTLPGFGEINGLVGTKFGGGDLIIQSRNLMRGDIFTAQGQITAGF